MNPGISLVPKDQIPHRSGQTGHHQLPFSQGLKQYLLFHNFLVHPSTLGAHTVLELVVTASRPGTPGTAAPSAPVDR